MNATHLLIWIPLVPLLALLGVLASARRPNLREGVSIAAGALTFALVVVLAEGVQSGAAPTLVLAEPFPGLRIALSPEPLGLLFALIASFLWPVTILYAIGYMRAHHEQNQTRFYASFAVSIAATLGIALAANMLTLFLFYELLTLATYPLVTHAGNDAARRAGRVYLGILMGTSVGFLLLAMVWTWQLTGTLDFTRGGVFAADADHGILNVLLVLYVFGTGKAALMPFHRWLPAAMVAPTPVSALLHAVAVVKAGVFTILKVAVYLFGIDLIAELAVADWLAGLAALTIVLASLVAMTRDNLKARLAYSTISQLSYIILGAMLGVAAGVVGGGLHIAMHAFGKITLFFCAGAIMVAAHKTRVSELDGLGRRMPLTMIAFMVGALSIIGLPPFGGTWSKWLLVQGTLDNGIWLLTAALLVSSLLNVMYLLVIPVRAFFREPPADQEGEGGEAPMASLLAIGVAVTGCLLLFFLPDPIHQLVAGVLR
ncbi:MAG: cation:proton antiporter [Candidatus Sedimenticola endophacoides]|uniref:Cation:proton antiporter n=2 Tax=Candidatus Sedimenticola endophacoides TaxID=2548426 RepID=A0A657Q7T7_9GAMM|nr:MAG: cation:proton antiporter [Candidatus Sedimenticola endophacoides]OQX36512.1 MAG: cation:proton antiporter [Candidatus Sedimenticola endophacoides]OQX40946.1 MAG: cation:proton antiporter [Candidatus Sedimenticola endophacoides]OQX45060.1 MAG: cation:proton antiporter [Candidatus Sedimenticola endophacoides]OQX47023.1 MAG: cation:proton antiporter [Candidatus Sedimenticola endophacoides]